MTLVSSACHPYRQRVLPPWNSKVDVVDAGHSHGSKKPPTIQSLPASSPSSSGNNEKKPSFVPSFSPSIHEDLTLSSVPQGYRKEYSDWTAIFNPKFVRNVDVDLVWSISQPRFFSLSHALEYLTSCYPVSSALSISHQTVVVLLLDVTKLSTFTTSGLAPKYGKYTAYRLPGSFIV